MNSSLSPVFFLVSLMLVAMCLRFATHHVLRNERSAGDPQHLIRTLLQAAGMVAVVFILLATLVLKWSGLSALDATFNASFQDFRAPWLLDFFLLATTLGTVAFAGLAVASVSVLFIWAGRIRVLIPLWVAFVGAELTTWVAKYAVNRARPAFLDGISELNPSFPSGHATASTVVLGFVGYLIASAATSRRQRVEAGFCAGLAIATVCLSRVFLSLHFLSDVLAGVLIGGMWLLIGIALAQWLKSNPPQLSFLGINKGRA